MLSIFGFSPRHQNVQQAGQGCRVSVKPLVLLTQRELVDTDSTGDAEECERESATHICRCSFCTVGHVLVTINKNMI